MSDSYLIIHPKDRFYWYSCYVQRVVDGDTVVLDFDETTCETFWY